MSDMPGWVPGLNKLLAERFVLLEKCEGKTLKGVIDDNYDERILLWTDGTYSKLVSTATDIDESEINDERLWVGQDAVWLTEICDDLDEMMELWKAHKQAEKDAADREQYELLKARFGD